MTQSTQRIQTLPLRERIRIWLQEEIVSGEFPAGSRLQDTVLAEKLGVSRTPVRETLVALASEGLVHADPNRGFSVPQFSRTEVEQLYPVIATLESLSLSMACPLESDAIKELKRINKEFLTAGLDAGRRHDHDLAWHDVFIKASGNRFIIDQLARLKVVARRYEFGIYMRDDAWVRNSAREHSQIVEALVEKQKARACRFLENHWINGQKNLLMRLDSQDTN